MANLVNVKGNVALIAMLRNITNLYPDKMDKIRREMAKNGFVMREQTASRLFRMINSFDNMCVIREEPRSSRTNPDVMLPMRFVFRAPFVQITYEGPHKTAQGREFEARLIYEFFDAEHFREAKEKIWIIFPYEESLRIISQPRIRTTQAFSAFETGSFEAYQNLQRFLFVMTRYDNIADLLKHLKNEADKHYNDKEERSRNFYRIESLFGTPAPSFRDVPA